MPDLTDQSFRELLAAATDARVLVVGDCMLDHYLTGPAERISPEAPVPVVRVAEERRAPGGAANVAAGVRALGGACRLVGVVGRDAAADELRELLRPEGIAASDLLEDDSRPTTVKTRVLARRQQMVRIDRETAGPLEGAVRDAVRRRALAALEWANVVALVDYDKGVLGPDLAGRILTAARERRVVSIADPKLRNFFHYDGATLFKPNGAELAAALGFERPPRSERELLRVRERVECEHLLVTLGEEGMLLLDGEGGLRRIPAEAREVYDVSGAGDTVTAVLAATMGARPPVGSAAALANFAAGIEVSHLGAVPISRDELLRERRSKARAPEEEEVTG